MVSLQLEGGREGGWEGGEEGGLGEWKWEGVGGVEEGGKGRGR